MLLQNLRFRTKLFIGFVIVIFFSLIISIIGVWQLKKVYKSTELIYQHPLAVSNAVRDINTCINGMHRSMKDVVLAENKEELDSAIKDVNQLNDQALAAFDIVFKQFLGDIKDVKEANQYFIGWEEIRNKVIILKQEGKDAEAAQITKGEGANYVWNLLNKTKVMSDFAQQKADEFRAESEQTYQQTINTLLFIIILVIALSAFVALIISKSILNPIHEFIFGIRALYQRGDAISDEVAYASEEDLLSITISELKNAYVQIEEANHEFQTLNEELDEKVKERTAELEKNQFELKEKNEEYLAINEEYETLNEELEQEIEERKQIELSLIKEKEYIEQIFDALPGLFYQISAEGKFVKWNNNFESVSRYSAAELRVMSPIDLFEGDDKEHIRESIEEVFTKGTTDVDAIFVSKDGSKTPYYFSGKLIKVDNIPYLVGMGIDISDLKQTQKKLVLAKEKAEESEIYLEEIINSVGDPVFVKDEQSRLLNVNKAFCKLFGLSKSDVIGKTLTENVAPEERESFLKIDRQVLSDGIESINEETLTVKGSETRILATRKTRFIDKNNNKFLVGVINDITQLKKQAQDLFEAKEKAEFNGIQLKEQNEEFNAINEELRQTIEELEIARQRAEESDRLKSAFLANMSHEIRTPMNGIIGFAKLMQKHELSRDKLENYVDIVVKSSNQLLSIVNDILDISRIETGQVELYENNINLNTILEEIKLFFKLKTDEKGIKLNLNTAFNNNEPNIVIDDSKLKQVLFNLIGNALKFTQEGTIEFGYKVKGQNLEFFVKDSGIGIPKKYRKHIFDRFRKVEHKTNVYGGTGLGLAICKGVVERMNGEIWVESDNGKGACFYFTLPYVIASETKKSFTIKEEDINLFKSIILIVEDEEINAIYLKEVLNKRNIKFIHAWNGEEAVNICSGDEKIDLVLMDIKLPKMDGFKATKEIKKLRKDLPVIAQTAYAMESDKVEALKAGCDDYISKPIIEENLIDILTKFLNNKF